MHIDEIVKEQNRKNLEKLARVKLWAKRMNKISSRKVDPLKEIEFCDRHDINRANFNRFKTGTAGKLPGDKFESKVEDAFAAEGV